MEVWNSIRKLDSNIILTTHYMEEASELSNKVIVFNEGQVVSQGTVRDLLAPFKNKVRVLSSITFPVSLLSPQVPCNQPTAGAIQPGF